MLGLFVKKGTVAMAVKFKGRGQYNYKQFLTKKDNCFTREDIVIDPINDLTDKSKENAGMLAVSLMFAGAEECYGFRKMDTDTGKRSDWGLIVRARDVDCG